MFAIYFLLSAFAITIVLMVIALIGVFKWFKEDRGGLSFVIAVIMFMAAIVCGVQSVNRLDAYDKAIAIERHK